MVDTKKYNLITIALEEVTQEIGARVGVMRVLRGKLTNALTKGGATFDSGIETEFKTVSIMWASVGATPSRKQKRFLANVITLANSWASKEVIKEEVAMLRSTAKDLDEGPWASQPSIPELKVTLTDKTLTKLERSNNLNTLLAHAQKELFLLSTIQEALEMAYEGLANNPDTPINISLSFGEDFEQWGVGEDVEFLLDTDFANVLMDRCQESMQKKDTTKFTLDFQPRKLVLLGRVKKEMEHQGWRIRDKRWFVQELQRLSTELQVTLTPEQEKIIHGLWEQSHGPTKETWGAMKQGADLYLLARALQRGSRQTIILSNDAGLREIAIELRRRHGVNVYVHTSDILDKVYLVA
ncbi:MAG: hypothetical protein QF486_03410 [Candidatus Woesearchaeota archaeon]|nr:hypothetical protein [Candidatus Woesearchaeota archaeon]MDP7198644.1 hypothetical protein [Candidatus Woesearchaeota archaeon]